VISFINRFKKFYVQKNSKKNISGSGRLGFLVQTLSDQEGELVGELAGDGHTACARVVVVEVSQLVTQLLELVRLEAAAVLQHVVTGGVDNALCDVLAD